MDHSARNRPRKDTERHGKLKSDCDSDKNFPHGEVTEKILGAAFDVYRKLGHGFLEKVYENALRLELKASKTLAQEHVAQLLNYLRASSTKVGLLLNFGSHRCEFKRLVY